MGEKKISNLKEGDIIYLGENSGLTGYGNPQCISWISPELQEFTLYGHNEAYKFNHIEKIVKIR